MTNRRALTEELKDQLKAQCLWLSWCKRRDALKADGMDARDAAVQTLEEFGYDGSSGPQTFRDPPGESEEEPQEESVVEAPKKPVAPKVHPASRLLAAAADLECGEVESVRWAVDHALIDWVEIESAPSRAAVTLLEWAKKDFREFMRVTWSKLLSGKDSSGPSDWMEAVNSLGSTIELVIKARDDARLEQTVNM